MEINGSNVEMPAYYNLDHQQTYADIYRVKYNSELVYVYIEFKSTCPSFEQFINAVKQKCKINENIDISIKDDKGCTIPDSITFVYYMLNSYNLQTSFEVFANEKASEVPRFISEAPVTDAVKHFEPIYENPDRYFVYFLSKDLCNYFKHQTAIICKPSGPELIEQYHIAGTSNLDAAHKKSIVQISANHLMLVKHNEPSVHDRVIWAKVICEVFAQLRDSNPEEYYFAVYNPKKGDGFLGNRIKLLMKASKKARENQAEIEKLFDAVAEGSIEESVSINVVDSELQNLVDFMKIANISSDRSLIVDNHKKTFPIRQFYRKKKEFAKLALEFPRFFDVDGLIDEDFALLYPLSGLITFTQVVQEKIVNIAQESKNCSRFPSTHKDLPQPLNALLHLIIFLPPTSLGRGQKNRVKLELAFPRMVKIHTVNQPLTDLTKDNPEGSPFIVVSGLNYYVVYDNQFIACQSTFQAIDIYFKVHFVFNAKFDSNIRQVLSFIGHYFYNIKVLTPTSDMRLISSRLFTI